MKRMICAVLALLLVLMVGKGSAAAESESMSEKSGVTVWECRNCGHIVVGTTAPEICPVCKHPQAYFEVRKENY